MNKKEQLIRRCPSEREMIEHMPDEDVSEMYEYIKRVEQIERDRLIFACVFVLLLFLCWLLI